MGTLLVVDDDAHIRNMLDVLLTLEGHDVVTAEDGEEALELLAGSDEFDAVVLDVMMPRMSGWEVAEQLRADAGDGDPTPIIFTTAKDDDQAQWYGWNLGAASYLVKPYNINDLLSELERVLTAPVA